ncbi:MAG: hypothetical protein ACLR1P_10695 [Oscillospiraceae bacterium]
MKDLDALKKQLARDGRLQRLQEIADSTDGQKLAGALDAQKIEQAARAGIPRRCGRSSRRCSARTPGSVWPEK